MHRHGNRVVQDHAFPFQFQNKAHVSVPTGSPGITIPSMHGEYFYVYIMSNRSKTLYTGFTNDLEKRVWQHNNHVYQGCTERYHCDRLVYYEQLSTPEAGINREKQIKGWTRARKMALIVRQNPTWSDLSEDWGKPVKLTWRPPKCMDPSLRSG